MFDGNIVEERIQRKCSIEDFSKYFLNFIRSQTDEFLRGGDTSATTSNINVTNPAITDNLLLENNDFMSTSTQIRNSIGTSTPLSADLTTSCGLTDISTLTPLNRKSLPSSAKILFHQSSPIHRIEINPKQTSDQRYKSNIISTTVKSKSFNDNSSVFHSNEIKSNRSAEKAAGGRNSSFCLGDFILSSPSTGSNSKNKHNKKSSNNMGNLKNVSTEKPKRRIVPTPVSKFANSAFRNENNILDLSKEEISDYNSCSIQRERDILKDKIDLIAKEFETEPTVSLITSNENTCEKIKTIQNRVAPTLKKSSRMKLNTTKKFDFSKITNKDILDRFIEVHSALVDLNLTVNVLNELSFLLSFLNVNFIEADIEASTQHSIDTPTTSRFCEQISDIIQAESVQNYLKNKTELNGIFKNRINCIYYSVEVLNRLKNNLALLDVTTLKVILDNEFIANLTKDFKDFLIDVHQHKVKLETIKSSHEKSFKIGYNFQNVSYQQENDTKNNFPTEKEFAAFKKQRDLFYVILNMWELKHLNPQWIFEIELAPKIHNLVSLMENHVNMAHLAKLFTSQLMLLSNFSENVPDLDIGLENVDINKLSKLQQRLVAPGHFSTDYQFPGNQAFFKDFLLAVNSVIFVEQLKIVLIDELLELNDSSYEIINLATAHQVKSRKESEVLDCDNEILLNLEVLETDNAKCTSYNEFVVRPETISTMRVLAKFLGLLISRPFKYDDISNSNIDSRQIKLRNKLQIEFKLLEILQKALSEHKLLITIPWIVQYLSMMDNVTLKLTYYRRVLKKLYEIHMITIDFNFDDTDCSENIFTGMRPTSIFIIKSCLEWLFNNLNLNEEYFNYRKMESQINFNKNIQTKLKENNDNSEYEMIVVQVSKSIANKIPKDEKILMTKVKSDNDSDELHCTLIKMTGASTKKSSVGNKTPQKESSFIKTGAPSTPSTNFSLIPPVAALNIDSFRIMQSFDPLLESILYVACPFLADFRISIMPTKLSKRVSRTGRLRHITTNTFDSSGLNIANSQQSTSNNATIVPTSDSNTNNNFFGHHGNPKEKLIEGFLHSQSLSVRRIVEFVIERTTSAVIKDYQMEILLPSKNKALKETERINSIELIIVENMMRKIFTDSYNSAMEQWDLEIPKMIKIRIEKALDALLPHETSRRIKQTCLSIVKEKCLLKTKEWRLANLNSLDFYSKDLIADAEKLIRNKQVSPTAEKQFVSTILEIDSKKPLLSEIFHKLQLALHFTSRRPELVNEKDLISLCEDLQDSLNSHLLPTSYYRVSGVMTVAIVQNLLSRHQTVLTDNLLEKLIALWSVEGLKVFINLCDDNNFEVQYETKENYDDSNVGEDITFKKIETVNIFDAIVSESFMRNLFGNKDKILRYSNFLIKLVESKLITIEYLNNKFMALLKLDWNQDEYKEITDLLDNVCRNTQTYEPANDGAKSHMFMEMLGDLIRDLEEF